MKTRLPYVALPIVISLNAVNFANLIEKARVLAPDISWDVIWTATILASTLVVTLLATILAEENRRHALIRRR